LAALESLSATDFDPEVLGTLERSAGQNGFVVSQSALDPEMLDKLKRAFGPSTTYKCKFCGSQSTTGNMTKTGTQHNTECPRCSENQDDEDKGAPVTRAQLEAYRGRVDTSKLSNIGLMLKYDPREIRATLLKKYGGAVPPFCGESGDGPALISTSGAWGGRRRSGGGGVSGYQCRAWTHPQRPT
jgi:hypothetical protein